MAAVLALAAAPMVVTSPVVAATSCTVRIEDLASSVVVGTPSGLTLTIAGDGTSPALRQLKVRYHISLPGLTTSQLQFERQTAGGAWSALADKVAADGDVKAVDPAAELPASGSLTVRYRLTLLPGSPAAAVTVKAVVLSRVDGTVVGRSSPYSFTVATPSGGGGGAGSSTARAPDAGQPQVGPKPSTTSADTSGSGSAGGGRSPQPTPVLSPASAPAAAAVPRRSNSRRSPADLAVTLVLIVPLVLLSLLIWRQYGTRMVTRVADAPPPGGMPPATLPPDTP